MPAPCVSICCVWRARDDRVWSVGSSESVPRFAVGQWAKFQGFLSSVEWRGWSYLDGRFYDPTKHFHNNFIYYLLKKKIPKFPTYWSTIIYWRELEEKKIVVNFNYLSLVLESKNPGQELLIIYIYHKSSSKTLLRNHEEVSWL